MWIIIKDLICEGSDEGVKSYGYNKNVKLPFYFQMYDDDGIMYYEGRSSEESFDPLDDFGMGNAGCTEIKYLNSGKWITL